MSFIDNLRVVENNYTEILKNLQEKPTSFDALSLRMCEKTPTFAGVFVGSGCPYYYGFVYLLTDRNTKLSPIAITARIVRPCVGRL